MHSVWLFTFSDLKTIVGPSTAFGIVTALSGSTLTKNSSPNSLAIIGRLPCVFFWVWITFLPFNIDNQRQAQAILEDRANKPWRSIPSGRLTASQAKYFMLICYPAALCASICLGAARQCVALIFFGWAYNDLGGADKSCITRNLINGLGYLCFTSGAAQVAARNLQFNSAAYQWFFIIGAVVVTTVQLQDTYDQDGDKSRGRWTVSLVLGDGSARWTIALPIIFWSLFCPAYWTLNLLGFVTPLMLGSIISFRVLWVRTRTGDKNTFKLWNLWMLTMYCLPLVKRCQG